MSIVPEKKLKQARLCFNKITQSKKRKLEDDSDLLDGSKFSKIDVEQSENDQVENVENNQNVKNENVSQVHCQILTSENESSLDNYEGESVIDEPNMVKMEVDVSIGSEEINLSLTSDSRDVTQIETITVDCTNEKQITEVTCTNESTRNEKNNTLEMKSEPSTLITTPSTKKFTAKQLLKKVEAEAKKKEQERMKQEKERKRIEEKEMKEKKRLAEIEAKNEEKRQKEEEKRKKEEEKHLKEEEKRAKEEEKRLKLEEKRLREEQWRKKKEKVAAAFTNFFVPKTKLFQTKSTTECSTMSGCYRFMPFEVKVDVKLADATRATLSVEQKSYLDKVLRDRSSLDVQCLYLNALKSKDYKPGHSGNTWPSNYNDEEDDSKNNGQAENETRTRYCCKLLQFFENRRPAYWGTWRKRSKTITGRNPFSCDTNYFEYGIESDEEWLEEPGESLHGSDDEKESDDDYEVDKDFMVPHGYLSDEEIEAGDDGNDAYPNTNKLKLNVLEKELEAELNEKTCKLKTRHYGCVWIRNNVKLGEEADDVQNLLLTFRGVYNDEQTPFSMKSEAENSSAHNTPSTRNKMQSVLSEQYVPDLIRLTHGYQKRLKNLTLEFNAYLQNQEQDASVSALSIKKKAKEISSWQPLLNCWYVSDDVRKQYNLAELTHSERTWKYVLYPQSKVETKSAVPERFMPDLVRLLHGNRNSAKNLFVEFKSYIKEQDPEINVPLASIKKAKKDISVWQHHTACWFVPDEIRNRFNLGDLSHLDNDWKYVSNVCQTSASTKHVPKQVNNEKAQSLVNCLQVSTFPIPKHSSITKFFKVLTPEEKERQLKFEAVPKKSELSPSICGLNSSPKTIQTTPNRSHSGEPPKKRAVLFSLKKDIENHPFANTNSTNHSSTTNGPVKPISENDFNRSESRTVDTVKFTTIDSNNQNNSEKTVTDSGNMKIPSQVGTVEENSNAKRTSSESNITIKKGKKYATLISIGKAKK